MVSIWIYGTLFMVAIGLTIYVFTPWFFILLGVSNTVATDLTTEQALLVWNSIYTTMQIVWSFVCFLSVLTVLVWVHVWSQRREVEDEYLKR